MKSMVKLVLQKLLGFKTYLLVFAVFVIVKLRWDKKEKDFMHFLKLVPDGGVILDIGANIGVTTYYLSKRFPESRIISFEPVKINSGTLKSIVRLFSLKNVQIREIALGDRTGTAEMVMPVIGKVKFHGLAHVIGENTTDSGITCRVPMSRLDELPELKNTAIPVHAMKLDVENFEFQVLKGGQDLIKDNHPVIYCELWDNENRLNCINFLASFGYKPYVLQGRELTPCTDPGIRKNNFFFLPVSKTN